MHSSVHREPPGALSEMERVSVHEHEINGSALEPEISIPDLALSDTVFLGERGLLFSSAYRCLFFLAGWPDSRGTAEQASFDLSRKPGHVALNEAPFHFRLTGQSLKVFRIHGEGRSVRIVTRLWGYQVDSSKIPPFLGKGRARGGSCSRVSRSARSCCSEGDCLRASSEGGGAVGSPSWSSTRGSCSCRHRYTIRARS
jgi:hypothetical protein